MTKQLKMIDLFSGAGGLTWGFVQAGFVPVATIENDAAALKTYNYNFKTQVVAQDISDPAVLTNLEHWKGQIDLVIGGFPCQGFSLAGKRCQKDSRNQLYRYTMAVIAKVQPRIFVLENVPGILSYQESDGVLVTKKIQALAQASGYALDWVVLNAADFGVAQKRRRVIFIGMAANEQHLVQQIINDLKKVQEPTQTVAMAIGDLANAVHEAVANHTITKHSSTMQARLLAIPAGQSLYPHYKDAFYKLAADQVAPTVKENHGGTHVHYHQGRVCTPRELARLQSFNDDFIFWGSKSQVLKQIGNAVPPRLAWIIAKTIKKYW